MDYIALLIGFALLIKGADYFVEGSSSVAKLMHIPTVIIGLTVVAFGTSLPELSVSVTASLEGANGLAVGNVLGSNLFNLLVVLGATAVIIPIQANKDVMKKDFPFSIIIAGVLFVLASGLQIADMVAGTGTYAVTRIGGVILLVLFIWFIVTNVRGAKKARVDFQEAEVEEEIEVLSPRKSGFFIVVGIAGIWLGGDLVVSAASAIGASWGMSESLIGLTIVALGTSLPELVTSLVAAKKGENDLALGNVIGSNIFNILLILGVAATISPITVSVESLYDMIILILASIMVCVFVKHKNAITRKEGIVLLATYAAYFVYIFNR